MFTNQAVTRALDDGENFELVEDLHWSGLDSTTACRVPAGFVSDFATVPRVAAWLIPKTGAYLRPAILHDWRLCHDVPAGRMASVAADREFREAMRLVGVGGTRRWLMWCGVRWAAGFGAHRRAGWWRTFPAVFGVSVLASPLVVVAAVVAVGLVWYHVGELIIDGRAPTRRSLST